MALGRFGKYQLLERIGVGGMAEVYKAVAHGAEGFERPVAIKRILPNLVSDEDFVKMFIDEAKIAVRLSHPNIVAIHDLGRAGGTLFIAMEFVPGRDVRAIYDVERERGGRVPIGIACHVVMKMCEALHHAHFATGPSGAPLQVIHRDVSPQNVLLSWEGAVKVVDFGLAKARGRMVQTQAGVVKGKLAYMSPEQLQGETIDHRVDIFGLGIVLYELLTGRRLFLGPSDVETLRRVYEAKVPPLRPQRDDLPAELERIARRALAREREDRFGTALELHDELQAFVYGHDCYANAAALRRYLRDAFPSAAPPDELPPFASAPPPARPTYRPPALPDAPPVQLPRARVPGPAPAPRVDRAPDPHDEGDTERPPSAPPVLRSPMIVAGALPEVPAGVVLESDADTFVEPHDPFPDPDTDEHPVMEALGFDPEEFPAEFEDEPTVFSGDVNPADGWDDPTTKKG